MKTLAKIWNNPLFFWVLLSLPSFAMVMDLFMPARAYGHLMHGSGEFSARFLVISLIITPLMLLSNGARWARWLLRRRRYIGVAAFAYAFLHTIFYLRHEGFWQAYQEWADWGILTGWLAFIIFIPLAFTSNNSSVRAMGPRWKTLQRLVYGAALFTALHWGLIGHWPPVFVHGVPVVLLSLYRLYHRRKKLEARA